MWTDPRTSPLGRNAPMWLAETERTYRLWRKPDLAVAVPATQGGLGVDRPALDVDLEVEVTADRDRVACLPHGAY